MFKKPRCHHPECVFPVRAELSVPRVPGSSGLCRAVVWGGSSQGQAVSATHLHATDAYSQAGRGALRTLLHVTGLLLLCCIISVLPRPHLQIQDAGQLVLRHHVLQQQEAWSHGVKGRSGGTETAPSPRPGQHPLLLAAESWLPAWFTPLTPHPFLPFLPDKTILAIKHSRC